MISAASSEFDLSLTFGSCFVTRPDHRILFGFGLGFIATWASTGFKKTPVNRPICYRGDYTCKFRFDERLILILMY